MDENKIHIKTASLVLSVQVQITTDWANTLLKVNFGFVMSMSFVNL